MNIPVDNSEYLKHLSAGLESSHEESKKELSQLHRFANSQYRHYPRIGEVREALKSLQPEQLLEVLQKTGRSLLSAGSNFTIEKQDIPQLNVPVYSQIMSNDEYSGLATTSAAESYSNASAEMTALIGKIIQLTGESSLEKMVSKLQVFNATMDGAGKAYSHLAEELEAQGQLWAGNADALRAVQAHAETLNQVKLNVQSKLDDAQTNLKALQVKAETQVPLSPLLLNQLIEANKEVRAVLSDLNGATLNHENYVIEVLNPAFAAEKMAQALLNATLAQATSLISSLTDRQHSIIQIRHQESKIEAKSLTFLIALMSQLISQNAGEDFKALALLKQKLSEAAARDSQNKALEVEAQLRKAEDLQKTMGCIGKVLGWVITTVCMGTAIFTGGSSMILGMVMLAIMAGDEIDQRLNNHSFIQDGMQPIMENIVQPLMKLYAEAYTAILLLFIADKKVAETAGQIMGAIATAMIMIAGTVLIGVGVGKIVGAMARNIGNNLGEKMLKKIMDQMFMQVLKRFFHGAGRFFNMDNNKIAQISNYTQMAVTGGTMVNTLVQAVGSIVAADMMIEAAKARARLMQNSALQDLLESIMTQAQESFSFRMEAINRILENICSVAENQMLAGNYITKKMNHVAG
ncbi:type III secretion system translocon subunit SctE [Erwinia amylovora]|uniref:type III secretion system translocon subunit SctE n=1 Tax=Erwinia amylovora TaxID=552 RepID=UPI001443EB9E|nr:type III secretion system translocon subunit SctE [Erwinia amylovora]